MPCALSAGASPEDLDFGAFHAGDALVVIGFTPYSHQSVFAARAAREVECTIVAIADTPTAPMAEGADHLLLFDAATAPGFFPSLDRRDRLRAGARRGGIYAGRRSAQTRLRRDRSAACGAVAIRARREPETHEQDIPSCHRSLRETPPVAVAGHGVWLVDADGREILDGSGGAAVSCLGHQHPRVLEAMARQAEKLTYAHTSFFTTEAAEELADELVGHEPGGLGYVYPVSGGSEAIEAALKMARQYFLEIGQPKRAHFIARRQSYHGNTLGALAAGGNAWRREPYKPLLADAFSHVTPAFVYREKRDAETRG